MTGPRADTPATHLLYLHGFRSSPQSNKSRRVAAWVMQHRPDLHWSCPQLPPSPREAMALIDATLAAWPAATRAVLGSSLGGFYATAAAERFGCRAVVMNPAVFPARDLAAYVGELPMYHDPARSFEFRAEYVDQLRALEVARISRPERYFALIAKGDELLDWREMSAHYEGAVQRVVDGSDHALSDFDDHLPHLLRFLKLCD
jgi:predicted esterase YcpF (UPF0227 family)